MRTAVVVTANLLLVALMFMLDASAAPTGSLDTLCQTTSACVGMDDDGWFQMGDRCVKAFHTEQLAFNDAEKACSEYKSPSNFTAHLVSIHSMEELDQVVCAMYKVNPGRPPYWIGLNLTFSYEAFMIYDWTDGTDLDFTYFSVYEPGAEACIETNYNSWGGWSDQNCDALRPFVCAVRVQ